jgi:flagellar biosynthetic protein FliP
MSNVIADQAGVVAPIERAWLHGAAAQFFRHLIEMVLAMMIGMAVLGLLVRAVMASLGYPDGLRPFPELSATAMTLEMTLPMAAWMLYRHHRRTIVAEMSGAMIVPAIAVVALCLVHVLPSSSAPTLAHLTMYPAMLGAMLYRRTEYTRPHGSMGQTPPANEHSGDGASTHAA